jgi:ribosomal protein S17E
MNFVIPVALQIHFFSKNKNVAGYMQESNRTLLISSEIKFSKSVRCFTEQGVAMLSSVLRSKRAVQVNIQIMRAFTQLRKMLSTHEDLKRKIESMEKKYDEQFQIVFEAIKQLIETDEKPKKKIGFTVKERQKAYVKRAKKNKPSMDGLFTPKAKKIWEAIAGDIQIKILNNVWCAHCRKGSSIGNLIGKIESGMLVLRGTCTKCGGDVARVIENE